MVLQCGSMVKGDDVVERDSISKDIEDFNVPGSNIEVLC